jgi:hypothetical protein
MKQICGEQIAKTIERDCRKDLAALGLPRVVVGLFILTAKGYLEMMSEETKEAFRRRRDDAKKLSERIANSTREERDFYGPNHCCPN